jgi:peptide/nickel transport system ATP-binding protein
LNLLSIQNLNAWYGKKQVLWDCNLSLKKGEVLSIVGESGSGKSTILKVLFGLQKHSEKLRFSGEFYLFEKVIQIGRETSMHLIYQEPSLSFNPAWTLEECLNEPQVLLNLEVSEYKQEMHKWLLNLQLNPEQLNQKIFRFSGGEMQRVAIARAILAKPKLICMDEPVSGLDRIVLKKTTEYIRNIVQDSGTSVLIVSHDLEFVREVSDRVAILYKGKILESGNPEEIFSNPKTDYTKSLLDARDLQGIAKKT